MDWAFDGGFDPDAFHVEPEAVLTGLIPRGAGAAAAVPGLPSAAFTIPGPVAAVAVPGMPLATAED